MAKNKAAGNYAEQIITFHEEGLKPNIIAKRLDIPVERVKRFLAKHIKRQDELLGVEQACELHQRRKAASNFSPDKEYTYTYEFNGDKQTINITGDFMAELEELDRFEASNDRYYRRDTIHIEALEFDSVQLSTEDKPLKEQFDGSPAFDYALSFLTDFQKDAFMKRLITGNTFASIANEIGIKKETFCARYKSAYKRFIPHYLDGLKLFSIENRLSDDRINSIPFGLSFDQVVQIRNYRRELYPKHKIAEMMNIPLHRVANALLENPVSSVNCQYCGKPIEQDIYGELQVFCNYMCYRRWYHDNAGKESWSRNSYNENKTFTHGERLAIEYYRWNFVTVKNIQKMLGISQARLKSYLDLNPITSSICSYCHKEFTFEPRSIPLVYCSDSCNTCFNRKKRKQRQRNYRSKYFLFPVLLMPEQINLAAEMRDEGFTIRDIAHHAGISDKKAETLFKYDPPFHHECQNCHKIFESRRIDAVFCSQACHYSFSNRFYKTRKGAQISKLNKKHKLPLKMVTFKSTILNAHLFDPVTIDGISIYTVTIPIEKKHYSLYRKVAESVVDLRKFRKNTRKKMLHYPFSDGDSEELSSLYQGHFLLHASSLEPPKILDHNALPLSDQSIFGSGKLAKVCLEFYPYKSNSYYGVGCRLETIQKAISSSSTKSAEDFMLDTYAPEYFHITEELK